MNKEYEFDVAYSFLAQDEATASALHGLLKDSVKSFIYSEEQKRLAGTNGEKVFNKVFSEQCRVAVILYRETWGQTPWTRVEETAIQNRAHDEGYDFALLIPMEPNLRPPQWFPKNRIWINLERWGIEAAASAIEARILHQDGQVRELTTADKLRLKLERDRKERERDLFLNSEAGRTASSEEYRDVVNLFRSEIKTVIATDSSWRIRVTEDDSISELGIVHRIASNNRQITVQPKVGGQGLIGLHITIWKGVWPSSYGQILLSQPTALKDWDYKFVIDQNDRKGWAATGKAFRRSTEIVEEVLLKFLDYASKSRGERSNLA